MIDFKNPFQKKTEALNVGALTAQELINVKDVRGSILYSKDQMIFAYIKLSPISLDLLSDNEKKSIMRRLTTELSAETKPFRFFGISRTVDISRLLQDLMETHNNSDDVIQKHMIMEQVKYISDFATTGDVVERQYFIIIWAALKEESEQELLKRAYEMAQKFENCGVHSAVADQSQIIQLCNLYANPSYGHIEDTDVTPTIPIINMRGGGLE